MRIAEYSAAGEQRTEDKPEFWVSLIAHVYRQVCIGIDVGGSCRGRWLWLGIVSGERNPECVGVLCLMVICSPWHQRR